MRRFLRWALGAGAGSASAGLWIALVAGLHGNWSGGFSSVLESVRISLGVTAAPNFLCLWLVERTTRGSWMSLDDPRPGRWLFLGAAYGVAFLWLLGLVGWILSPDTGGLAGVSPSVLLDLHIAAVLAGITTLAAYRTLQAL